jgi:hypothetical protein
MNKPNPEASELYLISEAYLELMRAEPLRGELNKIKN